MKAVPYRNEFERGTEMKMLHTDARNRGKKVKKKKQNRLLKPNLEGKAEQKEKINKFT